MYFSGRLSNVGCRRTASLELSFATPAEKRGKQSPVIPVKTGIQEGSMAMRPYKIASSFHSSQ